MTKEKGILRVLGNLGNLNGSKMHRVKLPLDHINGKKVNVGGEECVIEVDFTKSGDGGFMTKMRKADIFYNNFSAVDQAFKIGITLTECNTKLIEDVDDVFYLNSENPIYRGFNASNVKRHLSLADTVIVTNERLKKHCERFVEERNGDDFKPIHVSNNYLPNKGQWTYKPKTKREGKVAFGIIGSVSHLPDWKLLKGMIKIIGNNKKFAKQAKFVIAGFENNSAWYEIKSFFSGLKCEVEILKGRSSEDYMELYDHIDVVLAPLTTEEFNFCKSEIKIMECAMRDIPLIGSEAYAGKEASCCIALEPEDWQKWIWIMLENDAYLSIGAELGVKNRELNRFEDRINNLVKAVEYCANTEYVSPSNLKLYGITYKEGEDQYTEFETYNNSSIKTIEQKSYLFEYNPIIDIIDNKKVEEDYLGIFSWKMPFKTGLSKRLVEKLFIESLKVDGNIDVIGFSPNYFENKYLQFTEQYHPGFMELFELVCKDLNLEVKEPKNVVYSNFFIAKTEVYKEFVNNIIKPTIELLETKYKDLAWKNANYVSGLQGEELKQQTGLDFYPLIPFVLERLLSIWLENRRDLKFKQIG